MTEKWKPGQRAAIQWSGGELIVSASAGTGKTSVIIERAWQLVMSGRANVDELLIVTFTEDAADQLKNRFRARLDAEMNAAEQVEVRAHLREQLHRLDRAQISTIHAFCLRVVRENYHRLGIASDLRVLPPEQATLIQYQVLDRLFEDSYAHDGDFGPRFRRLVERYGGRRVDEGLSAAILAIHSFLSSLARPDAWLARVRELSRQYRSPEFSITKLAAWEYFKGTWLLRLDAIDSLLRRLSGLVAEHGSKKLSEYLEALLDVVRRRRQWLEKDQLEAIRDGLEESLPKSPPVRKESPEGVWWPAIKDQVDAAKDELKEWSGEMGVILGPEAKAVLVTHGEYLETLMDLVEEFSRQLLATKETEGHLEFDDLQRLAMAVLAEKEEEKSDLTFQISEGKVEDKSGGGVRSLRPSAVAETYRRKFKYVLVDEYQDINELQDGLIRLVGSPDGQFGARVANLFMVGDVKQSIYRFRLAEPEIFQGLYRIAHPEGIGGLGRIDLPDNFRSRTEVVDAVNAVFTPVLCGGELELEYDAGSRLIAAAAFPQDRCDRTAELHILERSLDTGEADSDGADDGDVTEMELAEREAFVVARRIRELLDSKFPVKDGDATRPVVPEDIVILFRSMRSVAGTYITMLRRMGLNAYCDQIEAFLEYPEIADIVSLLKVIDNPFQDIPLATVLRSPLVGADLTELSKIRLEDPGHLYAGLEKFVANHPDDPLAGKFRRFLDHLKQWRRTAGCCCVAELVQAIFLDTHYPDYVQATTPGRHGGENLDQFLDLAWRFSEDGRCDLAYFLNYLDLVAESQTSISGVRGGGGKGIRIQTIHASKGLEYPVVFLGGVGRQVNFQDLRRDILIDRELLVGLKEVNPASLEKTDTLPSRAIARSLRAKTIAEELRLLYVAMTRAKEKLILVGSGKLPSLLKTLQQIDPAQKLSPAQVAQWSTPLAWLTAALAADMPGFELVQQVLTATQQTSVSVGPFQVTAYPAGAQSGWAVESEIFGKIPPDVRSRLLGALEGKKAQTAFPVPLTKEIEGIVRQLQWRYPYADLETMPTSVSVTELVERAENAPPGRNRQRITQPVKLTGQFTFLDERTNVSLEKGKAWHKFLECLDLSQPFTAEALSRQLNCLVHQKLLNAAHARLIEVGKVQKFFKSPPGKIMLDHREHLRRELAFTFSLPARNFPEAAGLAATDEPVLVQGVVDCLIQTPAGFVIVDYKTNAITAADVHRMVEHYRIQLEIYAKALAEIVRARIAGAWLYFTEPDSAAQVI